MKCSTHGNLMNVHIEKQNTQHKMTDSSVRDEDKGKRNGKIIRYQRSVPVLAVCSLFCQGVSHAFL